MIKDIIWIFLFLISYERTPHKNEPRDKMQAHSYSSGVKWTYGLSWVQILEKAKVENKYIFVDCFATWCGPCKRMDHDVYPNEKVGEVMNSNFICVKVQMDKTGNDDENVKSWYRDAKLLQEEFKINSYPTFLFFSPNGKVVHRVSMGMNVESFLGLVSSALDPKKQYYVQLEKYKSGVRDTAIMRELAIITKNLGDKDLAFEIADEYISKLNFENLKNKEIRDFLSRFRTPATYKFANDYINHLTNSEIYTKDNLELIRLFTNSTELRGFKIFYNYPNKVNAVIDPTLPDTWDKNVFAEEAVRSIIYNEEFVKKIMQPSIDSPAKSITPNWIDFKSIIKKKFPKANTELIVADAKYFWYRWKKAPEYPSIVLERMRILYQNKSLSNKYFDINNFCWTIFLNTKDSALLNQAIIWMESMFKQSKEGRNYATAIDTYANLLYKVGRIKDALRWQKEALELSPSDPCVKDCWDKMNRGAPTWIQSEN